MENGKHNTVLSFHLHQISLQCEEQIVTNITHCEVSSGCWRTLLVLAMLDPRLLTSPLTVERLSAEVACTSLPSLSSWEMVV